MLLEWVSQLSARRTHATALNGARKLGAAQLLLRREGEQTLKRIRNQAPR